VLWGFPEIGNLFWRDPSPSGRGISPHLFSNLDSSGHGPHLLKNHIYFRIEKMTPTLTSRKSMR
jgi:hypothetical protein